MNSMVDEGKVAATDVCIFEMTDRVGGRLFSLRGLGPNDDLVVDAGGYRTVRQLVPPKNPYRDDVTMRCLILIY